MRFVNSDMSRTIHRFQTKFCVFTEFFGQTHRFKKRIGVILLVSRSLPQLAFSDMRRENHSVAAFLQFSAQVIFHVGANRAAFRMPENKPLPVFVLNRKQIQFFTEFSMVAFFGFFALFEPSVEFFLRRESSS